MGSRRIDEDGRNENEKEAEYREQQEAYRKKLVAAEAVLIQHIEPMIDRLIIAKANDGGSLPEARSWWEWSRYVPKNDPPVLSKEIAHLWASFDRRIQRYLQLCEEIDAGMYVHTGPATEYESDAIRNMVEEMSNVAAVNSAAIEVADTYMQGEGNPIKQGERYSGAGDSAIPELSEIEAISICIRESDHAVTKLKASDEIPKYRVDELVPIKATNGFIPPVLVNQEFDQHIPQSLPPLITFSPSSQQELVKTARLRNVQEATMGACSNESATIFETEAIQHGSSNCVTSSKSPSHKGVNILPFVIAHPLADSEQNHINIHVQPPNCFNSSTQYAHKAKQMPSGPQTHGLPAIYVSNATALKIIPIIDQASNTPDHEQSPIQHASELLDRSTMTNILRRQLSMRIPCYSAFLPIEAASCAFPYHRPERKPIISQIN